MPTYKLILRKSKTDTKGKHPIYIRVTINRKSKFKSTKIFISESEWDENEQNVNKSAKNYNNLHIHFEKIKSDLQNRILDLRYRGIQITHDNIWEGAPDQSNDYDGNLIAFLEDWFSQQRPTRTIEIQKGHFERLKAYSTKVNMHTVDGYWLEQYMKYLETVPGISTYSTIHSHMKSLRKFWNLAIKRKLTNNYPFNQITLKAPTYQEKVFLEKADRDKLLELLNDSNLPGYLYNTLIHFLIACYSGLRYSDWHQCKNVENGALQIRQKKKQGGFLTIPLSTRLEMLIDKRPADMRVFTDQRYRIYLKELAQMAGIDKHITTHTARHTFAMMCLNEAEMSFEMVASLLDDDVRTVKNHYARYHLATKRKEIRKLDKL